MDTPGKLNWFFPNFLQYFLFIFWKFYIFATITDLTKKKKFLNLGQNRQNNMMFQKLDMNEKMSENSRRKILKLSFQEELKKEVVKPQPIIPDKTR